MKLQCLVSSPVPGKYNCQFDFAPFPPVQVIEGETTDVSEECAAALVATGNFARLNEFDALVPPAPAQPAEAPPAPAQVPAAKKRKG